WVNLVLSMLRAAQVWGGRSHALPGLRAALGLAAGPSTSDSARPSDGAAPELAAVDAAETAARTLVQAMEDADWDASAAAGVVERHAPADGTAGGPVDREAVRRVLEFAATQIVPRLEQTTDEIGAVLHALDGGYIPAGPSGSPLRGLVNVLP